MPPILDQTAITTIIIDTLEAHLKQVLMEDQDDDAKAGLVRAGLLQDDPTTKKINVLIHTGGEAYPDEIDEKINLLEPYETGDTSAGAPFWKLKFVVEIAGFWENDKVRANARRKAALVMARAFHAIYTHSPNNYEVDDFGATVWAIEPFKKWLDEGGGEGDFNWRGSICVAYRVQFEFS